MIRTKTNFLLSSLILVAISLVACQKENEPLESNKPPVANAGDAKSVLLPSDSVLFSGSGTDADGKVVAYLWSQVSGPNSAVIVNPGSPSTWVKGLSSGKFLFQLMVTDDQGLTSSDTVSVSVGGTIVNQAPAVDAGPSLEVLLPKDTARLSGTSADADGKVVSYLWSELAGPNVAYIVTPNSPSTQIRGLEAGTYLFQLRATDDKGATGVDTMTVIVREKQAATLVLQPNANINETMLAVRAGINVSDWTAAELTAAKWTNGGDDVTVRSFFKFDLSGIPANATIVSAKLTLFSNPEPKNGNLIDANFGSNNSLFIQRVTSAWDRNSTWQNQPSADALDRISIPHTDANREDLINVDVTEMVKKMTSTNYGFMIRLQNEVAYTSRIFCSSKYADAAKHPKLVIMYQ